MTNQDPFGAGEKPQCCSMHSGPAICRCLAHWHPHRRGGECEQLDKHNQYIDSLIEASSIGSAAAKAIRDSVDDESVQRILDRVNKRRGLA